MELKSIRLPERFINDHLKQFGAHELPRAEYHELLDEALQQDADFFAFEGDKDVEQVLTLALAKDLDRSTP